MMHCINARNNNAKEIDWAEIDTPVSDPKQAEPREDRTEIRYSGAGYPLRVTQMTYDSIDQEWKLILNRSQVEYMRKLSAVRPDDLFYFLSDLCTRFRELDGDETTDDKNVDEKEK